MPYYGLLDERGHELQGGGYHRLDVANAHFKISPPSVRKTDHLTFINVEAIQWPQPKGLAPWEAWDAHSIALFDEVDSKVPLSSVPLEHRRHVHDGDLLIIAPGSIRIGWKWQHRDDDDDPPPTPPASKVTELLTRERDQTKMLRKECEMLREENDRLRKANILLQDELHKIKHV